MVSGLRCVGTVALLIGLGTIGYGAIAVESDALAGLDIRLQVLLGMGSGVIGVGLLGLSNLLNGDRFAGPPREAP